MKYILIWLIKGYRKIPGPWHNCCKFKPTCSEYAIGVINEFGFCRGIYLSIKRIVRCNYFSSGGYDPIPLKGGSNSGKY